MPVKKCPNGKWRIGSGPCRYSSKEKAEKAWRGAQAAGAKSKASQSEAGFMKSMGVQGAQCGECANFVSGGGSCTIIDGIVNANDICNLFEPSLAVGDMNALFAKEAKTFDMYITKATQNPDTGEKRWAAVASDTDLDSYGDRMSLDLYNDFIERAEHAEIPPTIFTSDAWKGGMPYLGLAHYLDLNGEGIVGDTQALYVDGNRLKAKGAFRDNEVGEAAFSAIKRDRENNVDPDQRIRISIAFVDWGHNHGESTFIRESLDDPCPMCAENANDKIYKRGHLVHLALTRVPVNERTPVWLEERSMTTIKDDALAVLGEDEEELVDKIDTLARGKSEVLRSEAVVIKSDEDETEADLVEESEATPEIKALVESCVAEQLGEVKQGLDAIRAALESESVAEEGEPMTEEVEVIEEKAEVEVIETPVEETPLDAALSQLKAIVIEASSVEGSVEDRFSAIQPAFNQLADIVKSTVKGEKVVEAEAIGTAVAEAIRSELAPLAEAVQLLAQKSSVPAPKAETPLIPGPRGYSSPPAHLTREERPKSKLTSMIRKSVGLPE